MFDRAAHIARFEALAAELQCFADAAPPGFIPLRDRGDRYLALEFPAPDERYRSLSVELAPGECDLTLGKAWREIDIPDDNAPPRLLAFLDALRDGRVKKVDAWGEDGAFYLAHLTTRGVDDYTWINEPRIFGRCRKSSSRLTTRRLPPWSDA